MLPSRLLFEDLFNDLKVDEKIKCDIYEKDGNYMVEASIPGFKKDDIKIEVDKGNLTIIAEKEESEKDESKKYIRRERNLYGKYQRSFYLGDIDEENVQANFSDGILEITIPKKQIETTKKFIEIN